MIYDLRFTNDESARYHAYMKNVTCSPKRKVNLIWKIIIGMVIFLLLVAGTLFTIGYFYYGKIIKNYIIETVKRESKGLYRADIGHLRFNVLAGNLSILDMELIPDTALYRKTSIADSSSPMLFQLKMKQFKVSDFRVLEAVRNRRINISAIRFSNPEVTVFKMAPSSKAKEDRPGNKLMSIPLPKGWNAISIGEIKLENGKVDFYDLSGDSVKHYSIPSCDILVKNILADSAHQGKRRLFNADDISIRLAGLVFKTKNGLNEISLGEIGLSTGNNSLTISNFHLTPQFNRYDYTRKVGFQTDRMDIYVKKIMVQRLNLRELILAGKVQAGLLEADSLVIDDYRDKRIPRKPGFRPPMPQDGLRKLKTYLKIDTVLLNGGKATYSEQVNNEPGTLFFDKLKATLTGVTNDSLLLAAGLVSELKGTAYLMGKGKLDATIRFKFGDLRNAFTFSAQMGPMDLPAINPMLTKLLPAEVKSGKIKQLIIPMVVANDDEARGKLLFYYNDLSIAMTTKKETTWNAIKKGVINFVANDLVVNNDNPTKSGKMKTGIILFHRDKEKGIINFLWKSTMSGLKSTMGFNSKEQKEIKKTEKREKKAKK
ncbi:MAG: hypothetical protein WCI71_01710 [Bacteroidota bacterium]